jgi:hypothetical protein
MLAYKKQLNLHPYPSSSPAPTAFRMCPKAPVLPLTHTHPAYTQPLLASRCTIGALPKESRIV